MKIVTLREIIKGVPQAWKNQFFNYEKNEWRKNPLLGDVGATYESLMALNTDTCSAEEMNSFLNFDWAGLSCDECEQRVDVVVQVGEKECLDSRTANLCFDCLKKATKLMG